MLLSYLKTKYHKEIEQGYGALEAGNWQKAEEHFMNILDHEDDPQMTIIDSIEAHNGRGAVALAHRDLFDAWRWYKEAEHLLDRYYKKSWPSELSWNYPHDRPALRTLIGLGHTAYAKENKNIAKKYYACIIERDKGDELGIRAYMAALASGKSFDSDRHWKK